MSRLPELDAITQSVIAELANIVTGQAGIGLEKNGFPSDTSPPILLLGKGSTIATLNLTRLVVRFGDVTIDISVKEAYWCTWTQQPEPLRTELYRLPLRIYDQKYDSPTASRSSPHHPS